MIKTKEHTSAIVSELIIPHPFDKSKTKSPFSIG